jgi:hypothetical protein
MNLNLFSIILFCLCVGCRSDDTIMIDADGNQYPIRTYGETNWMTQNLMVKQDTLGNAIKYYYPNDDRVIMENMAIISVLKHYSGQSQRRRNILYGHLF